MFLKVIKHKNGKVSLSIVHGYRDPKTGKRKHMLIESLGYAEKYKDLYDDPIAHFKEVAKNLTEAYDNEETEKKMPLGYVSKNEQLEMNEDAMKMLGNIPLMSIYHELKINQFFINRQRSLAIKYSLNDIMQLLVYTRILSPGSKRHSYAQKDKLAGSYNCLEHDVYRALGHFDRLKEALLLHIHEQVHINYQRKTGFVFYDVTNFYFEIDQEDDFRKKGACKKNSRKPLVQMGLLLDEDAIPITFNVFTGNTHDSQTLMPIIKETRDSYELGKIITVADKVINLGDNIASLMEKGDGFIFSQNIRDADQEFRDYVLDKSGYNDVTGVVKNIDAWMEKEENKDTPAFFMKSRPYPQEFWAAHSNNKGKKVPLDIMQIVCYNELYARRQKYKRAIAIEKALKPESGECIKSNKTPYLDEEKIAEDEKYDGYYAIITSEYNMPPAEVVKAYHGLWEIEHSFEITKSDLDSRPVEVTFEEHIKAHFLTCFISLLILRLLDKRLKGKFSREQIISSLRKYQACYVVNNVYRVAYYDEILNEISKEFNLNLRQKFMTVSDLRQLAANSKKKP